MLMGLAAPLFVPMIFFFRGHQQAAYQAFLVLFITLSLVTLLKAITSRISPEAETPIDLLMRSQAFRFGLFEAGLFESVFEGWPSGHAATNTAMALVVAKLTQSSRLRIGAYCWAVWVLLATVFGIGGDVHWFSDSISGLVIGLLIARSVQTTDTSSSHCSATG